MLVLLFSLGEVMYTVKCDRVREIIPVATLREIIHAPEYFSGFFTYRGIIVPVIDLGQLIRKQPCRMRFSTRIILVDYERGDSPVLGLIAERVTREVREIESAIFSPAMHVEKLPYLKGFLMEQEKMIQYLDLDLLALSLPFLPFGETGGKAGREDLRG